MTKQHFLLKGVLLSSVALAATFGFSNNESGIKQQSDSESALDLSKLGIQSAPTLFSDEASTFFSDPAPLSRMVLSGGMSIVPKTQIINHIVQAGETLSSLWQSYGASTRHAVKVMEDLRDQGLTKLGLKKGELIKVAVSPEGELLNFEKRLDDGRTVLVKRAKSSDDVEPEFETEIVPADIEETERTVSGTIKDSLAASAQSLGLTYGVVDDMVDLFSSRIHFTKDIQPGDSFAVTFREKRSKRDGSLIGEGAVTQASFTVGGKLMAVFGEQGSDAKTHYVDESGSVIGNYFLRYPLTFTRISSYFTFARFHPILQRSRPHYGVDFAAPVGTAVRSVGDGVIVDMGFKTEPGNWIKIQHNDRWSTAYMHLSAFAPGLKKGAKVSRGQLIGAVGQTGLATGPHLHFSLYDNGTYVNPLTTDLPQMDMDSVKIPKMILVQKLEAVKALHEKARLLAANIVTNKVRL